MAIYGSPTVGRLGILTKQSSCNQASIGFVVDFDKITNSYMFYKLFSLRDHFNAIAAGAAQQNISRKIVVETKIVTPKMYLQKKFEKHISYIHRQIKTLTIKNKNLHQTRDHLLPKLISGQVDVSDLNIDVGES